MKWFFTLLGPWATWVIWGAVAIAFGTIFVQWYMIRAYKAEATLATATLSACATANDAQQLLAGRQKEALAICVGQRDLMQANADIAIAERDAANDKAAVSASKARATRAKSYADQCKEWANQPVCPAVLDSLRTGSR